jgi:hypothetical protein
MENQILPSKEEVDKRVKHVLNYLFPDCENTMTAKQYNNATEALRSIVFGTPDGKKYAPGK